jgi:hypothetical protein
MVVNFADIETLLDIFQDVLTLASDARTVRNAFAAMWGLESLTEDEFIQRLRNGIERGKKFPDPRIARSLTGTPQSMCFANGQSSTSDGDCERAPEGSRYPVS